MQILRGEGKRKKKSDAENNESGHREENGFLRSVARGIEISPVQYILRRRK